MTVDLRDAIRGSAAMHVSKSARPVRALDRMLMRMRRYSRRSLAVLSTVLVLGVGAADFFANTDISFSAIYVLPIAIVAWFVGEWFAFGLSALAVVLWIGGDVTANLYDSAWVPLWNSVLRLIFYGFVVKLLSELRGSQENLEARAEQKARALTAEIAARENLESELLRISEREQRRFGQDIHDSLCQHLTATALAGQALTERLGTRGDSDAARAARVVELVEQGIALSRDLAKGLNPIEMRAYGLMEAFEEFARTTSELFPVHCRFESDYPVPFNDADSATHVYRIAQEAVSNAIKHGKAKTVSIRLETLDKGKLLKVIDDGSGFVAPRESSAGMGLRIMSYRARVVGGWLDIESDSGRGTCVTCFVPDIRLSHG